MPNNNHAAATGGSDRFKDANNQPPQDDESTAALKIVSLIYAGPVLQCQEDGTPVPELKIEAEEALERPVSYKALTDGEIERAVQAGGDAQEHLLQRVHSDIEDHPAFGSKRYVCQAGMEACAYWQEELFQQSESFRADRYKRSVVETVAQWGSSTQFCVNAAAVTGVGAFGALLMGTDVNNVTTLLKDSGLFEEDDYYQMASLAIPAIAAPAVLLKMGSAMLPQAWRGRFDAGVSMVGIGLAVGIPVIAGSVLGGLEGEIDVMGTNDAPGSGASDDGGTGIYITACLLGVGMALYGLGTMAYRVGLQAVDWASRIGQGWRLDTDEIKTITDARTRWNELLKRLSQINEQLDLKVKGVKADAMIRFLGGLALAAEAKGNAKRVVELKNELASVTAQAAEIKNLINELTPSYPES